MKNAFSFLFAKKPARAPGQPVASAPATTAVIGSGYDEQYPMLPKFVIERAVEGGFEFHGSLGPENVLDLKFFRALARTMAQWHSEADPQNPVPTPDQIEAQALTFAHTAYDFYLTFFILPKEEAQAKVAPFWRSLLLV